PRMYGRQMDALQSRTFDLLESRCPSVGSEKNGLPGVIREAGAESNDAALPECAIGRLFPSRAHAHSPHRPSRSAPRAGLPLSRLHGRNGGAASEGVRGRLGVSQSRWTRRWAPKTETRLLEL